MTLPSGSPPADASHGDTLDQLTALYQDLLASLEQEREALARGDAGALENCVTRKDALCSAIADAQQNVPLQQVHGDDRAADADPRLIELETLARQAREQNGINGHMAHRARQTVRALLDVLTGTEQPVYAPPRQDHQPPSTGRGQPRFRV